MKKELWERLLCAPQDFNNNCLDFLHLCVRRDTFCGFISRLALTGILILQKTYPDNAFVLLLPWIHSCYHSPRKIWMSLWRQLSWKPLWLKLPFSLVQKMQFPPPSTVTFILHFIFIPHFSVRCLGSQWLTALRTMMRNELNSKSRMWWAGHLMGMLLGGAHTFTSKEWRSSLPALPCSCHVVHWKDLRHPFLRLTLLLNR